MQNPKIRMPASVDMNIQVMDTFLTTFGTYRAFKRVIDTYSFAPGVVVIGNVALFLNEKEVAFSNN